MSLTEAQSQFAAEFITLMISAAALALVLLRPPAGRPSLRTVQRLASALGLLAVAVPAFLHGSLLVTSTDGVKVLALIRLIGAAAAVPALASWWSGRIAWYRTGAWVLRAGMAMWAGAGASQLAEASSWLTDALLVAGAVIVGVALAALTRRSIALRVAASGASALLLVVLVLSLSLSAVISSSVKKEELNRLSTLVSIAKNQAANATVTAVGNTVKTAGAAFSSIYRSSPVLAQLDSGHGPQAEAAVANVDEVFSQLALLPLAGSLSYVTPTGFVLPRSGSTPPAVAQELARTRSLTGASCSGGEQGLLVSGTTIWAAASYPVCTTSNIVLGTLFAVQQLDQRYLHDQLNLDPTLSVTLIAGGRSLVGSGLQPPASLLNRAVASNRGANQAVSELLGDRYIAIAPLPTLSAQPLWLAVSTPATTVLSTRTQLDRTLFLIALGGTILALGLAIFASDRITNGIRRLTDVATRIQAGDTNVRAEMAGDDEVAALGSAFDSMLDSVSMQAYALQAAADDETRLRNRMEAVVAGMSDALVAVDQFGRITDFNRAAEEMTGVRAARARRQPAAEVVRIIGDDGASIEKQLFRVSDRPRTAFGELQRSDGTRIPVAVSSGGLIGPGGELVGTVLVFRDLRREQEVESMKTEFLSRVGHELRTPLTGIMGYTEILLRRDVPADRSRLWHEEMLTSARRLLRIVEMLEFFASSGAGRMVLRLEPVDVRTIVGAVATSWAARKPDNIIIRRRVARNVPIVLADRRWLSLAIDELVDNAVKFSPDGGPILLEVNLAEPPGGNGKAGTSPMVEISVRDRGMGMSVAEYDLVFGDFVQGDTSDTRRFGGLGLGLSVVSRVVGGHGGEILCRSAPGKGTTLIVRIPAAEAAPATGRSLGKGRRSPTAPHAGS